MKSRLKNLFNKLLQTIKKQEMRILPGQLAFFFLLSIIPLLAVIASIASMFNISTDSLMGILNNVLPTTLAELFEPVVMGKNLTSSLVIFYISAFILASNGTHSIIIGSNEIYKFKSKGYLSGRVKALMMTIVLVMLLLFVLVVPAFGDKIVATIVSFIKNEHIVRNIELLYNVLKYPISIFLIYFNIKLLYTMAPDERIKSKETTYGSLFTTVGWIVSTEIYSLYVDIFANYNLFYGSIANLLILMIWVYILAYIFVLGMALNSSHYQTKLEVSNK